MASEKMAVCVYCKLELPGDEHHHSMEDCCAALQRALVRQREMARLLAFDLSTQYLAAIEELCLRPDVGIAYKCLNPDGSIRDLAPTQVVGIFTAILKKFQSLGDWSPMRELRDENRRLHEEIATLRAAHPLDPSDSQSPPR